MQINDAEITVVKSKNFEDNYFTSEVKKDKETGDLVKDEEGKIRRLYKKVYLPEGTQIENTARIRFKGYTGLSFRNDGSISEYIVVQEILEYVNRETNSTYMVEEPYSSNEFGDDLPF